MITSFKNELANLRTVSGPTPEQQDRIKKLTALESAEAEYAEEYSEFQEAAEDLEEARVDIVEAEAAL